MESQASGLPCIISNTITREIDFGLGLIEYCDLNDNINVWIEKIMKLKDIENVSLEKRRERLKKLGYDVNFNLDKVMKLYGV